jgi:hypothetical protein
MNNSETHTTASAAVTPGAIVEAIGGIVAPAVAAPLSDIDWYDCDSPFDGGILLDFHAHSKPLCPLESDNNDASISSNDDSILMILI